VKRFSFTVAGVAVLLFSLAGCGEQRAKVSGTVTFKDRPVPGGKVIFVTEDGLKNEHVEIKSDGTYSSSNVPYGKLKVAVQPVAKSLKSMIPKGAKMPDMPEETGASATYSKTDENYVDIPTVLRNPDTSNITLTVDQADQTFNIPLADVHSKSSGKGMSKGSSKGN
jgi:hypothetical protein